MRKLHDWKVWGVLGLLLALVLVVGYAELGRQPGQPLQPKWTLTTVHSVEANGQLSLFINRMDMHCGRNLAYQAGAGVALFFRNPPDLLNLERQVYLIISELPGAEYNFKACFRWPDYASGAKPTISIRATFNGPAVNGWTHTFSTPGETKCFEFNGRVPYTSYPAFSVSWLFKPLNNSLEFLRAEVEKVGEY